MADENILTLTDEAIAFVRDVMTEEEDEDGELALAIEVSGIKWPAFAYELSFIPLSDARTDDIIERHDGLAVVIPAGDTTKLPRCHPGDVRRPRRARSDHRQPKPAGQPDHGIGPDR